MDFARIGIELIVGFFGLFVVSKFLGKTQITQITAFDFISALVLGELVGNAVYDKDIGLSEVLFAITVWGALIYMIEMVTQKSLRARTFFEGKPTIIIHKGRILRKNLGREKLDLNQLQHLLRAKGVFSITEIEFAILETDGSINVMRKSEYDTPTRKDLHVPFDPAVFPITLIVDGDVLWSNVKAAGFSDEWLKNQLTLQGIKNERDVFFAEWIEGKGLHIQTLAGSVMED
ncbi:DUF421 domain-containing protein [Bacillus lacus]|uniref:DUF421 domain-containing protein n=1 Tax=Metabacillus lacus TaxID=1983721 RepID=A0A7X2IY12_9BACI|nr:DUF421 domain-containing protein [Metabacillus lacus]MRX71911.1 DUF421 domain-containing protein [Metabacillus lacus]